MTIRIKRDRIEFTANGGSTFTLAESNTGFTFDGTIQAYRIFQDGFQGSVSGYGTGGVTINTIDKYPLATDSNATDVGDLSSARFYIAGASSRTHGYAAGGVNPGTEYNTIDKFPFSVDTNSTNIGSLTGTRYASAGQSSPTFGYASGGQQGPTRLNTIEKYPFSADSNATDVGDLTQIRSYSSGQSSIVSGYTSTGQEPGPVASPVNTIDKFPFATDTNAKDVGDLSYTSVFSTGTGQSSATHGYSAGGYTSPTGDRNEISKFPFASDTNATSVGTLTQARRNPAGVSSVVNGYAHGGADPARNTIDKFPFASDANATDVGDLTVATQGKSGHQY